MNPEKKNQIDKFSESYESNPLFRAAIQSIPNFGGAIDTILASRATNINRQRFEELILDVNYCLSVLENKTEIIDFFNSEEYFEIFRRCTEIVMRTANSDKRKIVAKFLAQTISTDLINDLSTQILEDINLLQPIHLQTLKFLPNEAGIKVNKSIPPMELSTLSAGVYEKSMSDLERMGFIRYTNIGAGNFGGGGGGWETTEYIKIFKRQVEIQDFDEN